MTSTQTILEKLARIEANLEDLKVHVSVLDNRLWSITWRVIGAGGAAGALIAGLVKALNV